MIVLVPSLIEIPEAVQLVVPVAVPLPPVVWLAQVTSVMLPPVALAVAVPVKVTVEGESIVYDSSG